MLGLLLCAGPAAAQPFYTQQLWYNPGYTGVNPDSAYRTTLAVSGALAPPTNALAWNWRVDNWHSFDAPVRQVHGGLGGALHLWKQESVTGASFAPLYAYCFKVQEDIKINVGISPQFGAAGRVNNKGITQSAAWFGPGVGVWAEFEDWHLGVSSPMIYPVPLRKPETSPYPALLPYGEFAFTAGYRVDANDTWSVEANLLVHRLFGNGIADVSTVQLSLMATAWVRTWRLSGGLAGGILTSEDGFTGGLAELPLGFSYRNKAGVVAALTFKHAGLPMLGGHLTFSYVMGSGY